MSHRLDMATAAIAAMIVGIVSVASTASATTGPPSGIQAQILVSPDSGDEDDEPQQPDDGRQPETECDGDDDCADDQVCWRNRCVDEPPEDDGGELVASACRIDDDCPGGEVCYRQECVGLDTEIGTDTETTDDEQEPREDTEDRDWTAAGLPDDGGADQACGADRRCRIERLAARNRMRRHYDAARDEEAVRQRVDEMFEEQQEDVIRRDSPWTAAIQYHAFGAGIFLGRMLNDHFRAEATLVYHDENPHYSPDRDDVGQMTDSHEAFFGTAHLTYFPSRAWFSPLISTGFGIGRGEYGFGDAPSVRYHYLTAAVGAEAQLGDGFTVRAAYRYGRLLHNQVSHGPGNYDAITRAGLRDWMHDEKLRGFDFSIGWAF